MGGRKWESRRAFQRLPSQESWGGRRWAEGLVKPRPRPQFSHFGFCCDTFMERKGRVLPPRSVFPLLLQMVLRWRKWDGEKVNQGWDQLSRRGNTNDT